MGALRLLVSLPLERWWFFCRGWDASGGVVGEAGVFLWGAGLAWGGGCFAGCCGLLLGDAHVVPVAEPYEVGVVVGCSGVVCFVAVLGASLPVSVDGLALAVCVGFARLP